MNNKLKNILISSVSVIFACTMFLIFFYMISFNKKNIIYFYIDDSVFQKIETNGNEILKLPTAPEKTDYTFEGWYFDKDIWTRELTENFYENTKLQNNVSVYAYYKEIAEIKYDINFFVDDSMVSKITTAGNEMITLPTAPYKEGYTFEGWYFDENIWSEELTEKFYLNNSLTSNVNVYAYYKEDIKEYTISFMDDIQLISTISTAGNEVIELPTAPNKDGFEFIGWFFDKDIWTQQLTSNYYENTKLQNNVSVYAYYKEIQIENKFWVNFETNGGETISPIYTSRIDSAPIPQKGDSKFLGWYYDQEFTSVVSFPLDVVGEMTLYAKWEETTESNISFNVVDGVIESVEILQGENISLTIPSIINGQQIKKIGSSALSGKNQIIEIVIDEGITELGYRAFYNCANLNKVTLPNSLKTIGSDAFSNCYKLTNVNFGNGLEEIGSSAFYWCNLQDASLPDSIKTIGTSAFQYNGNLETVRLGNVVTIGEMAFQNCTALQSVVIPESTRYIYRGAFYNCRDLSSVTILSDFAEIYYNFLGETAFLKNDSNWENDALYVNHFLITTRNNLNLTSYKVKDGTTVISDFAFNGASKNITSIELPEGLKIIGEGAFEDLNKLSKINMPDSVEMIKTDAFSGTAIITNTNNENWYENGLYLNHFLIAVKNVAMETFQIKEGTTKIIDGALFGDISSNVTNIILPNSLISIGNENFKNTKITTILLNANLEYIGENAFYGCKELTTVTNDACINLNYIGSTAFAYCNIESFYIPKSVTVLGNHVFNFNLNRNIEINCEFESAPETWHPDWNKRGIERYEVNWGVKRP